MNKLIINNIYSEIDISIIIVNYKSWEPLTLCLNSILEINQNSFTFETIVVDNHSNDGQLSRFSEKYCSFHFIENSGNNGYSNACNLGVKMAKGNYMLFLNPDTILNKDAVLTLFKLALENPNYGVVSCNIVNAKGSVNKESKVFPSFLTMFGLTRFIYRTLYAKSLKERFDISKRIVFPDWVTGSVIFMSKDWIHKIGGWNEDFWMYYEDVDICKKVNNLGGHVALSRDAKIIHIHGGATRINKRTIAITKTEFIISNHIYINTHFKRFIKEIALTFLVINTVITNLLFAILGLIFFFIPKLHVRLIIFINLIRYYTNVIKNCTWLSKKAMNFNIN